MPIHKTFRKALIPQELLFLASSVILPCDTLIHCSFRGLCHPEERSHSKGQTQGSLGEPLVLDEAVPRLRECSNYFQWISAAFMSFASFEMQCTRLYSTGILPYHAEQRQGVHKSVYPDLRFLLSS